MKNINKLLYNMTIDNLKKLKFEYCDELTIKDEDIKSPGEKYWLWKYYKGIITKEEHEKVAKEMKDKMVCHVYDIIYSIQSFVEWDNDDSICKVMSNCIEKNKLEDFCNEVADLWLMRLNENFQYEDEFQKLIFMLYCNTEDERFRTVALDFYKTSDEAKKYAEKNSISKSLFLIYNKDEKNFNKHYGIAEKTITIEGKKSIIMQKEEEPFQTEKENWIIKRFGGAI